VEPNGPESAIATPPQRTPSSLAQCASATPKPRPPHVHTECGPFFPAKRDRTPSPPSGSRLNSRVPGLCLKTPSSAREGAVLRLARMAKHAIRALSSMQPDAVQAKNKPLEARSRFQTQPTGPSGLSRSHAGAAPSSAAWRWISTKTTRPAIHRKRPPAPYTSPTCPRSGRNSLSGRARKTSPQANAPPVRVRPCRSVSVHVSPPMTPAELGSIAASPPGPSRPANSHGRPHRMVPLKDES
jgi:hypothetical protein